MRAAVCPANSSCPNAHDFPPSPPLQPSMRISKLLSSHWTPTTRDIWTAACKWRWSWWPADLAGLLTQGHPSEVATHHPPVSPHFGSCQDRQPGISWFCSIS